MALHLAHVLPARARAQRDAGVRVGPAAERAAVRLHQRGPRDGPHLAVGRKALLRLERAHGAARVGAVAPVHPGGEQRLRQRGQRAEVFLHAGHLAARASRAQRRAGIGGNVVLHKKAPFALGRGALRAPSAPAYALCARAVRPVAKEVLFAPPADKRRAKRGRFFALQRAAARLQRPAAPRTKSAVFSGNITRFLIRRAPVMTSALPYIMCSHSGESPRLMTTIAVPYAAAVRASVTGRL